MTSSRKTVKELNVIVEALEEKVKNLEKITKVLEKYEISDILNKVKKIDIVEEKLNDIQSKIYVGKTSPKYIDKKQNVSF